MKEAITSPESGAEDSIQDMNCLAQNVSGPSAASPPRFVQGKGGHGCEATIEPGEVERVTARVIAKHRKGLLRNPLEVERKPLRGDAPPTPQTARGRKLPERLHMPCPN